ncbi:MAG: DUF1697 domain-containing protein [Pyrinomonadaceae bacterium]
MPRYVAFLRAINVGGHVVKMDYLRSLFEGLGFTNVETFIASGNVVFDSSSRTPRSLEMKIERHLQEHLGYEVKTFVRSAAAVANIAASKPFGELEEEGVTLYIGFVAAAPTAEAKKNLAACCNKANEFVILDREVFWLCRKKFSESDFSGAQLEKILGMKMTIRNANTAMRIAARYS